jgi:hypothetical protein
VSVSWRYTVIATAILSVITAAHANAKSFWEDPSSSQAAVAKTTPEWLFVIRSTDPENPYELPDDIPQTQDSCLDQTIDLHNVQGMMAYCYNPRTSERLTLTPQP